ncbi:hypothetical protein AX14_003796 [Amanita brunnescens Koide BX004]|nr:hypothetical protein AX14_003796 [Amanita brunnescens Koide BX004]
MSWQAYVDTNLVGSGKVTKAAILGQKGGVWASSPGFTLSAEEQKAVVTAFDKRDQILASGLRLAGQKYFGISVDGSVIQLKKGADGAVIAKTKQAIIVAAYQLPLQSPETTVVVTGLADYLISANY